MSSVTIFAYLTIERFESFLAGGLNGSHKYAGGSFRMPMGNVSGNWAGNAVAPRRDPDGKRGSDMGGGSRKFKHGGADHVRRHRRARGGHQLLSKTSNSNTPQPLCIHTKLFVLWVRPQDEERDACVYGENTLWGCDFILAHKYLLWLVVHIWKGKPWKFELKICDSWLVNG